jgi:hypothetical protein
MNPPSRPRTSPYTIFRKQHGKDGVEKGRNVFDKETQEKLNGENKGNIGSEVVVTSVCEISTYCDRGEPKIFFGCRFQIRNTDPLSE